VGLAAVTQTTSFAFQGLPGSEIDIVVNWTAPDDPQPGPPPYPLAPASQFVYSLSWDTDPQIYNDSRTIPGSFYTLGNNGGAPLGWVDGPVTISDFLIPYSPTITPLTFRVGVVIDGILHNLQTVPIAFTNAASGEISSGSGICGQDYTFSWSGIQRQGDGDHTWEITRNDTQDVLGSYTFGPSDYPTGTGTVQLPPNNDTPYTCTLRMYGSWNNGSPYNYNEPGTHEEIIFAVACGSSPNGDGAWDQSEIDELLARQAALVASANAMIAGQNTLIGQNDDIIAALQDMAANGLSTTELENLLSGSTVGAPGSPLPSVAWTPTSTALSAKLSAPTLNITPSSSLYSVTLPMPSGPPAVAEIELNPDNWSNTGFQATLNTFRLTIRALLAGMIGLWFVSRIWQTLRQY